MCGIAGVFVQGTAIPGPALARMLDAIRHRGHSLNEVGQGPGWAIGANRLEIVDRSNGRQPFFSEDDSIAVVLNGEIYNHKELRRQLIEEGYRFRTEADTEVIAHGYHYWNDGLFDRLDGMFAIIIHDRTSNSYIAARDPMGVKPLYYAISPSGTFMASEIKSLSHLEVEIAELPPGHVLHTGMAPSYYVTWPTVEIHDDLTADAATLRRLFTDAIRKRVDTDLPVAVLLSGGIDSSAVIYEVSLHHPNVMGFTIGSDDSPDVLAAKRLCEELNLRLIHFRVTAENLTSIIPKVIWAIESFEPNHIRGGCLSYVLSREVARAGYRVALCGEGADELFGGYREFGLALARGETPDQVGMLMDRFVAELYKTQLKRVDRTSMSFTLEVREPYLDKNIVAFAKSLPLDEKVSLLPNGQALDKKVLREAYRGILPDWVVDRAKVVFSLGAGFDSNGPEGVFFRHAHDMLSQEEFDYLRARYPDYGLRNREEAYYFTLFRRLFGDLTLAKQRPVVNATPALV